MQYQWYNIASKLKHESKQLCKGYCQWEDTHWQQKAIFSDIPWIGRGERERVILREGVILIHWNAINNLSFGSGVYKVEVRVYEISSYLWGYKLRIELIWVWLRYIWSITLQPTSLCNVLGPACTSRGFKDIIRSGLFSSFRITVLPK